MSDVWFYHLERQPVEQVLPRILAGMYARGDRVVVQARTKAMLDVLSKRLWAVEDTSFVPHGFAASENICFALEQSAANTAPYRIIIDGAEVTDVATPLRTSIFFDGTETAQVERARELWKSFRTDGHVVRYWKQDSNGRWADQAAAKAA
jgi:DNA polymerase III subunit chi